VSEYTPPPSPGDTGIAPKIDTEGINDDIVTAVIQQLEKTGNRPHLIRELAAVLSTTSDSVAKCVFPFQTQHNFVLTCFHSSANPAALLSSRLSLYLRRPWTALAPCPLAKELIPIHPRKVFFYLTTSQHQPLPENSDDILSPTIAEKRVFSPSISNASIDQEDEDARRERERMSPIPEIDLSTPELDDIEEDGPGGPPTPAGSFSGRSSMSREGTLAAQTERLTHQHRAVSPPLEGDEREFTQTASSVRDRGMSLDGSGSVRPTTEAEQQAADLNQTALDLEETAEITEMRNRETADALFGQAHLATGQLRGITALDSSPMVRPKELPLHLEIRKTPLLIDVEMKDMDAIAPWELTSPENVELDELDVLLGGF
jgi:hypothetical protein